MLLELLAHRLRHHRPRPGRELQRAEEFQGRQTRYYGRETSDPSDSPLTCTPRTRPPSPPPEPDTTVHGVPAEFTDLTDDGQVYGRGLRWIENGVELSVELDGKPTDGALRAIAESVQAVPLERWRTLIIATSRSPNTPPAGSKAVVVRRSGGWTLTALLPPGFPVAAEDERLPCFRLRFRGDSATDCARHPTWGRLGGAVYVFGIVSPRVRNVRVVAEGVGRVTVPAVRARGYGLARFYAARLPTNTCEVVDPQRADGPGHRPVRPGRQPLGRGQAPLPKIKGPVPL